MASVHLNMDYNGLRGIGFGGPLIGYAGFMSCFKVQGNFLLLCSSNNFVGYSYTGSCWHFISKTPSRYPQPSQIILSRTGRTCLLEQVYNNHANVPTSFQFEAAMALGCIEAVQDSPCSWVNVEWFWIHLHSHGLERPPWQKNVGKPIQNDPKHF